MSDSTTPTSGSITTAIWRTRPIFLSSTFRDMHTERGWLLDHVIPELEERLRARRHHLEVIDLRWGVETTGEGEQEQKELLVLKVCLAEIERSRPFLVALLGDRYGWVPPPERMQTAVDEAGFATDVAGKSVTALEIEFGVLGSPDQRRRTHFYFRDPLPYEQMPREVAAQYSDAYSDQPGAQDAHDRLEALKERIRQDPQWAGRWHDYSAGWDADDKFTGTPEERLLQLLVHVAQELPADIEDLYGWLLRRAEEVWGAAWARAFAELIAVSRGGWRELDFQALLPKLTAESWDPLRFAGLRRAFRAHLVQRGPQEQWDFFHAQMRTAIERRYLGDEAHRRALHLALADHLESLPEEDPLREREMMFHLIGADARERAARYYAGYLSASARAAATSTLASHIVATQDQEPNPGLQWVLALLQLPDLRDEALEALCQTYLFVLRDALVNEARLVTQLALLEGVRHALRGLCEGNPDNLAWQRDLWVSHNNIGDVRVAQGDLGGAERAYQARFAIAERLAAADPDNAQWQRDLYVSCWRMADLTERTDPGQALGWWRKAHDALARMRARGMHLSPADEGFLEQLERKVRG